MRRTRPLLFVLLALLVAVAGVVVLRDPPSVAGTAVAGSSAAPATTTAPPVTTTTTPVPSSTTTTTTTTRAGAPLAGKIKPGEPRQGVATFYDSDGGGACSYDPGPDPLTAAMNEADYEGSAACGAHVLVQAGGKSITVRITNLCPAPCRPGQLDLSAEAFALLAPPVKGEIPVTWSLVSPETAKTIAIRYKTGSSQYWCGIQVLDHRNPLARLEVQAGGQWRPLKRAEYNYFLAENGAGCGGAIAVTDVYGERLVVNALSVKPDAVQATNLQFARAGE
ncbi:expansin EXLX1 family cellulose-binding protein [Lentzea flaviverrucosa]|uniref:Peptidoglycan-binding domain-containing protein, expansin n=1 Tax=Lentzea flaviverrucosa TaxID=200379 RepID=A0A1H9J1M2_9PSEU|nr:expansin EXLX1 family cellulose-binding protein [Lentzea flaviverrucosa]RDI26363.1 expansin (peptidoglycan-binding protein) [Lentzea flaviverrucosa]SEQ80659.1 Peptidoglycan-binding domain-containing protein, expansin [Lentzea flaviverrucosa]